MALRARNSSPWGLATLNPQSTCHGRRPEPTLAAWCSDGLPACHRAESTRKDPRRKRKICPSAKKNTFILSNIPVQQYVDDIVTCRYNYFRCRKNVHVFVCLVFYCVFVSLTGEQILMCFFGAFIAGDRRTKLKPSATVYSWRYVGVGGCRYSCFN